MFEKRYFPWVLMQIFGETRLSFVDSYGFGCKSVKEAWEIGEAMHGKQIKAVATVTTYTFKEQIVERWIRL